MTIIRNFGFFLFLVIILQLVQILYFQRGFFIEQYDISYWKDRLEHSQWQLPLSKRIIGDDGLFSYVGYQLVKTGDPAGINAETPPVGKYLIGLSIVFFKNPAFYALFLGLGSLVLFYVLAKKLFKENILALFVTALLFLDPLFFTQLWKAWVDIPHLFFLLTNVVFLFLLVSKSKSRFLLALLSGLALGLFAETKFPLLLPVIFLLETGYFFLKGFKKEYPLFIIGILSGVLIPYVPYLMQGNSILDIFRIHKYTVGFYLISQLQVHIGSVWPALFSGWFADLVSGLSIPIREWWLAWPIVTLTGLFISVRSLLKKSEYPWKGLSIFILATLLIYSFIPLYTRYLLLILPFLYLFFGKALASWANIRIRNIIMVIFILYGFINTTVFLFPTPSEMLKNFYYNLSHQYFQDIYQENLSKSRPPVSREEFRFMTQGILEKINVKAIEVKEEKRNIQHFSNRGTIDIAILYKTQDLGGFHERKKLDLVKENNQWKIKWNWNIFLNGYTPDSRLEVAISKDGERGSIIDGNGIVLVEDAEGYLISLNPQKMDTKKESEMIKVIERLGYRDHDDIQNEYLENSLPGEYVPLVTTYTAIGEVEKKELLSYPGLRFTPHLSRIYRGAITPDLDPNHIQNTFYKECCTKIYSSYSFHGVAGLEKKYDKILFGYRGGKIVMKDKTGRAVRTILEKSAKEGKDVILPVKFSYESL